jgi:hypothetical protein
MRSTVSTFARSMIDLKPADPLETLAHCPCRGLDFQTIRGTGEWHSAWKAKSGCPSLVGGGSGVPH